MSAAATKAQGIIDDNAVGTYLLPFHPGVKGSYLLAPLIGFAPAALHSFRCH